MDILDMMNGKGELGIGELIEIETNHLTLMEQYVFHTYVNLKVDKWRIVESIRESKMLFNYD